VFTNRTRESDRNVILSITDTGSTGVGSSTGSEVVVGIAPVKEINSLVILNNATKTGSIAINFNDGTVSVTGYVTVSAGSNAGSIATAIYYNLYGMINGYTVTNPGFGIVCFTKITGDADKNVSIILKDK
jgi:hypothetical protein